MFYQIVLFGVSGTGDGTLSQSAARMEWRSLLFEKHDSVFDYTNQENEIFQLMFDPNI